MPMADGFDQIFNEAIRDADAGAVAVEDAPATPAASDDGATPPAPVVPPVVEAPKDVAPVVPADTVPPVTADPKAPTIDKMGRYHRSDGTVMTKAEVESYKATQVVAPVIPVAEVAAPVVEAPQNVPYVPEGQRVPIYEGSLRNPAGDLFVPAAQVDALERDVMRGRRYDQYREDRRTAFVERERTQAEMQVFNDTLVHHFATPQALQKLVEAVNEHGVQAVQREIALAMKEGNIAIKEKFGAGTPTESAVAPDAGNATPLDPDDAGETFGEYWREQLALPEFAGMPPWLKESTRESLTHAALFVRGNDGAHYLNENSPAAVAAWNLARNTMKQLKATADARTFNDKQQARSAATPAPPSVATARPGGTTGHATPTATKDPMIDPKTGKEYLDPWQAILKA